MAFDFKKANIRSIHTGLKEKEFSAIELTRYFLDNIKKNDKKIKAFLTVLEKTALSQAQEIDRIISQKGEIPVLAGIPGAIKDNILVKGVKCTAGSKMLANYRAPYQATVIEKLLNEQAVILGKTNLDEFAMGSSTENSAFFPTRNPYDLSRVPGGSSGGSVAAVASEMAFFSLGSDTGGSIRLPASFCGVVGLKPTYGAVSRYGLIAFASSLDQIGPITRNIEDAEIIFNVIRGKDKRDATSCDFPAGEKEEDINPKKIKIGIAREYFVEGLDKRIESVVRQAVRHYEDIGCQTAEVSLPHLDYALAVYCIISASEASANLARYDGMKYGFSTMSETSDLLETYLKSRENGFGREVKRRILLGTYSLSAGYYQAYYQKAQQARHQLMADFKKIFQKVDVLIGPVSPFLPFKIGEKIDNPLAMYLSDIYTVAVNLAGLPALSFPFSRADGLPVGLQIIGPSFTENRILSLGKLCENYAGEQ